jgi:hypothetical protein
MSITLKQIQIKRVQKMLAQQHPNTTVNHWVDNIKYIVPDLRIMELNNFEPIVNSKRHIYVLGSNNPENIKGENLPLSSDIWNLSVEHEHVILYVWDDTFKLYLYRPSEDQVKSSTLSPNARMVKNNAEKIQQKLKEKDLAPITQFHDFKAPIVSFSFYGQKELNNFYTGEPDAIIIGTDDPVVTSFIKNKTNSSLWKAYFLEAGSCESAALFLTYNSYGNAFVHVYTGK